LALPTLEKTWQFNVNQVTATSGVLETDVDNMLVKLIASLTGFGSAPWTVVSCSNGTTVASTNQWTTPANIVHNNGAHSWIVLKQTGCGGQGNFQICFDMAFSPAQVWSIIISTNAGFTGGSVTARPTATDEQLLSTNSYFTATPSQSVVHVLQTTDGASTRFFLFIGGTTYMTVHLESQADCLASNTAACVAYFQGTAGFPLGANSTAQHYGRHNSTTYVAYITGESIPGGLVCNLNSGAQNQLVSAYHLCPMGVYSNTSTVWGRVGRLVDLWWGSSAVAMGSSYPLAGGFQFVQFGAAVYPWNGTTPVIN